MIFLKQFKLFWQEVNNYQIISWWDTIKIQISIYCENLTSEDKFFLDISNFSKKWVRPIIWQKESKDIWYYEVSVWVEFLWFHGVELGIDNMLSRVSLLCFCWWKKYVFFSNPIWNASYETFCSEDHHLWVYTKGYAPNKKKLRELSKHLDYKHDIIFKNRFLGNTHFIDVSEKKNIILSILLKKIKENQAYVIIEYNIDTQEQWQFVRDTLLLILKFDRYIRIYFYNFPFCFFREYGKEFIEKYMLYNGIFRIQNGFEYFGVCSSCSYRKLCNNISKKYKNRYWLSDFSPL